MTAPCPAVLADHVLGCLLTAGHSFGHVYASTSGGVAAGKDE